jgi:hypothetical protein
LTHFVPSSLPFEQQEADMKIQSDYAGEPDQVKLLIRDLDDAQIRIEQLKATIEVLNGQIIKEVNSKLQYIENIRRMQDTINQLERKQ